MRVSLNWLRDHVDVPFSPDALGQILTMMGLEVEGVERVGHSLDGVVTARILEVGPHPDADRLTICRVDAGGRVHQVVCGAPNLQEGAMVAFALPGVRLPDGTEIRKSEIRGMASEGMLLAEDELGLTGDHSGMFVLPPDAEPGAPFARSCPVEDWVFDIGITPNRPDCACIMGVAREIAAATGSSLRRPEIRLVESGPPIDDLTSVEIRDPKGCPRYAAGVILGVTLGPAPFWMRYRLHLCGIRSINNIVDVTNYVLLERGQPLHAFDYRRLRENRIIVQRAREGERFATLDGEVRGLSNDVLMICDAERHVAVGGIMGGLNSEIFPGTEDVLVESACFDPVTIRRGSKHLSLSTEASYRFERGVDIDGVTAALRRALALMNELGGGRIASGIIDNYPRPRTSAVIELRVDRVNRFLGTCLSKEDMRTHLCSLEMAVEDLPGDALSVKPPSFRVDLTREVDLAEEVARLHGYDNIPVTSPSIKPSEERDAPELEFHERTRGIMTGLGFTEVITYSFVAPQSADILGAREDSDLRSFVSLLNPLTADQSVMRTSLAPGLMGAVQTNWLREERDLRLFEWGKTFIAMEGEQLPREGICLAAVMTGLCQEKTWYAAERPVDFFDIKGAASAFLKSLGLADPEFRRQPDLPGYDPGAACSISHEGVLIGRAGVAAPALMAAYDLEPGCACLFELDMGAVMSCLSRSRRFQALARYPAVYRDISVVVDRKIESRRVREAILAAGGELVEDVRLFDLYEGEKMGRSEKALAFRIRYRSMEATLEGAKVNRLHASIVDHIQEETGGRLREG